MNMSYSKGVHVVGGSIIRGEPERASNTRETGCMFVG